MNARMVFVSDLPAPQVTRVAQRPGQVGWRMVAANNRPLGRAGSTHTTLDDCVASARELSEAALAGRVGVRLQREQSRWFWTAEVGGQVAAVSAARYSRRSECERAGQQFLDSLLHVRLSLHGSNFRLMHLGRPIVPAGAQVPSR